MCNSLVEDLKCQEGNIGNFTDQIYFNKTCQRVGDICQQYELQPVDGANCFNMTTMANVTLRQVIPRVFSSEEFYL